MNVTVLGGGSPLNKFAVINAALMVANDHVEFFVDASDGNDAHDGKTIDTAFKTLGAASKMLTRHNKVIARLVGNTDCVLTQPVVADGGFFTITNVEGGNARLIFDGGYLNAPSTLVNIQVNVVMRASAFAVNSRALGMVIMAAGHVLVDAGSNCTCIVLSTYGSNQVYLYHQSFESKAGLLPVVKNTLGAQSVISKESLTLTNMSEV